MPDKMTIQELAREIHRLLDQSLLDNAMERIENGLVVHGQKPILIECQIRALLACGRVEEALHVSESLPLNIRKRVSLVRVVNSYCQQGRPEAAAALLAEFTTEEQEMLPYQLAMVDLAEHQDGAESALRTVTRFRKRSPTHGLLWQLSYRLFARTGRLEEAIDLWPAVPEEFKSPLLLGHFAMLLERRGRYREAIEVLRPVLESGDAGLMASIIATRAFLHLSLYSEALELAGTYVAKYPDNPALNTHYWTALERCSRPHDAVESCNRFLEERADDPEAVVAVAKFFLATSRKKECTEVLSKSLELYPYNESIVCIIADYHFQDQDVISARDALVEFLESNPASLPIIKRLLRAYELFGDYDAFFCLQETASQQYPDDDELRIRKARVHIAIGELEEAQREIEGINALTIGMQGQTLMSQSIIEVERGNPGAALIPLKELLEYNPDSTFCWLSKSIVELILGDLPSAVDSHRKHSQLKAMNDLTGQISAKSMQSLHGQILNEYRLLTTPDDLDHCKADANQIDAARYFKQRLTEYPRSTPHAMALCSALKRSGKISYTWPADHRTRAEGPVRIPRNIFQFWDSPERPAQVRLLMDDVRDKNSGYSYEVFDSRSSYQLLRDSGETAALRAFKLAPNSAGKADILRLVILWQEGGIFLDADDRCLVPFDDVLDRSLRFLGYQEKMMSIGNNFIAVERNSPIIRAALDDACQAFDGPQGESLWLGSGPGAVTRAVASVGTDHFGMPIPGVVIISDSTLRRAIATNVPLSYKVSSHWTNAFKRQKL